MPNRHVDEGSKIQALTMLVMGRPMEEITRVTGISKSQINRLRNKAKSRGWGGDRDSPLRLEHVKDDARSGRPPNAVASAAPRAIIEADAEGQNTSLNELALNLDRASITALDGKTGPSMTIGRSSTPTRPPSSSASSVVDGASGG